MRESLIFKLLDEQNATICERCKAVVDPRADSREAGSNEGLAPPLFYDIQAG